MQDITRDKEKYPRIIIAVLISMAFIFMGFGMICSFTYGAGQKPLISDELPYSFFFDVIRVLFIFNVIFSYPLQLYPANAIIEGYLFSKMPKSKKRQTYKNISRTIVVAYTVWLTLFLGDKVQNFLSINGALSNTPIAFLLPALFHYKKCAETPQ
jgi:solute carrier family 36 (proton-coupled amino acid transporter)